MYVIKLPYECIRWLEPINGQLRPAHDFQKLWEWG